MATPQYAIAQSGSAFATGGDALAGSRYPKEGRSATPRPNGFCTAALHETGNRTCPIFSASSAATPAVTTAPIATATSHALAFMASLLSDIPSLAGSPPADRSG